MIKNSFTILRKKVFLNANKLINNKISRLRQNLRFEDDENKDRQEEIYKLLELIRFAKNEWKTSIANFDYATENEIIDYYIYKIKASQLKYDYLLRQAKKKGLRVEFYEACLSNR